MRLAIYYLFGNGNGTPTGTDTSQGWLPMPLLYRRSIQFKAEMVVDCIAVSMWCDRFRLPFRTYTRAKVHGFISYVFMLVDGWFWFPNNLSPPSISQPSDRKQNIESVGRSLTNRRARKMTTTAHPHIGAEHENSASSTEPKKKKNKL